jgi:Trp operon repressor
MFCRKRRLKRVSDRIFKNALQHAISSILAAGITDIERDKNNLFGIKT